MFAIVGIRVCEIMFGISDFGFDVSSMDEHSPEDSSGINISDVSKYLLLTLSANVFMFCIVLFVYLNIECTMYVPILYIIINWIMCCERFWRTSLSYYFIILISSVAGEFTKVNSTVEPALMISKKV